jgi:hypothetical protein
MYEILRKVSITDFDIRWWVAYAGSKEHNSFSECVDNIRARSCKGPLAPTDLPGVTLFDTYKFILLQNGMSHVPLQQPGRVVYVEEGNDETVTLALSSTDSEFACILNRNIIAISTYYSHFLFNVSKEIYNFVLRQCVAYPEPILVMTEGRRIFAGEPLAYSIIFPHMYSFVHLYNHPLIHPIV